MFFKWMSFNVKFFLQRSSKPILSQNKFFSDCKLSFNIWLQIFVQMLFKKLAYLTFKGLAIKVLGIV